MLTPSRASVSGRFSIATPLLGKPIRLTSACASGARQTRGFSFPICGNRVIVPTSTCPNPNAASPRTATPFLSYPAARPTGILEIQSERAHLQAWVIHAIHRAQHRVGWRRSSPPQRNNESVRLCAVSGSSRNNSGRKFSYMIRMQETTFTALYCSWVTIFDGAPDFQQARQCCHGMERVSFARQKFRRSLPSVNQHDNIAHL